MTESTIPTRLPRVRASGTALEKMYWVIFSACLFACVPNAWREAAERDTVDAYREFVYRNPRSPHVVEARTREAELVYRALGERPREAGLRGFVRDYPNSPLADDVRMKLAEQSLDDLIAAFDLAGLRSFAEQQGAEALQSRAFEASEYLVSAADPMVSAPFEDYLAAHPGGEFAKDARWALTWQRDVTQTWGGSVKIEVDGRFESKVLAKVKKQFARRGAELEIVRDIDSVPLREDEVSYRLIKVQPGDITRVHTAGGKAIEFTSSVHGIGVEVLRHKKGKNHVVWSHAQRNHHSKSWLDFPVVTKPTSRAIMATVRHQGGLGELARVGPHLAVAHVDGVYFYDVTIPRRPRRLTDYSRMARKYRPETSDIKAVLAGGGWLVGAFGEGFELLNCRSIQDVQVRSKAHFTDVGQVTSGQFVGDYFYLASATGVYVTHPDWDAPSFLTSTGVTELNRSGKMLVTAGDSGLSVYPTNADGTLARAWLRVDSRTFPKSFDITEPIIESFVDGARIILVNSAGDLLSLRNGKVEAPVVDTADVGSITRMAGGNGLLVTVGDRGASVLKRTADDRFALVASLPITGCTDVEMQYPTAYLSCGTELVVVHVGALAD